TMAAFTMCLRCQAEYDDPLNRRFHAQPNACADCGPRLTWRLTQSDVAPLTGPRALEQAVEAIVGGRIVAMKGIGGYHLVADATNEHAIAELRRRKERDDKPFALMVASLAEALTLCELDGAAE